MFDIKPSISRDNLQRVEFRIVGLDCKACLLGVYQMLSRIEDVEQATANFADGLAVTWIDSEKTNTKDVRVQLKRRVVLRD